MSDAPLELALERPVRTSRLVLRTLRPDDAGAVHAYRSLPEVARYVPFEPMDPGLIGERLGMRREAPLVENEWFKGEWSDEVDYALLEHEWAELSAALG
jgi:RimJ/RimL family protein N-acetyltransferase